MQGGQKGLFVNSTNLCQGKHHAHANATGQNGRRSETKPLLRAQCGNFPRLGRQHLQESRGGSSFDPAVTLWLWARSV